MSNKGLYGSPTGRKEGSGGVFNYANLDKDLSLSVADMGKTININTPNNYSVKLPDARQLASVMMVVISNFSATQVINVKDNNGLVVKTVMPMQSVIFWATSKATSGGAWIAKRVGGGDSVANNLLINAATQLSTTTSYRFSICQINANQAIAFYSLNSNYAVANVITLSGSGASSAILFGTLFTVSTTSTMTNDCDSICPISATQAVVIFTESGNQPATAVLTVSGTGSSANISKGTTLLLSSVTVRNCEICQIANMKVLVTYDEIVSGSGKVCALTISGTTLTAGTIVSVAAYGTEQQTLSQLSTDVAIISYTKSTGEVTSVVATISGTNITLGTPVQISATTTQFMASAALSSNQLVILVRNASFYPTIYLLTINGTAITVGAVTVIESNACTYPSICAINNNQVIVAYSNLLNYLSAVILTQIGSSMLIGSISTISPSPNTVQEVSICGMNSSQALTLCYGSGAPTVHALTAF